MTTTATEYPIDLGCIDLYRGDASGRNKVTVTMLDDNDDPVDLTQLGDTWGCQAKGNGSTFTLDVDSDAAASGVIEALVKDADSAGLPNNLDFDIQVTGGTISPLTLYKGRFRVSGQVTT